MKRRVMSMALAVILALALILTVGCKTAQKQEPVAPQSQAQPPAQEQAAESCEVRFLNFMGEPFPVLIRRLDGPGHKAFMLQANNEPMTKEQFDAKVAQGGDPGFKYFPISGVPCGTYRVMAPTLGLVSDYRICDCKGGTFNIAFWMPSGQGREVKL